MKQFGTNIYGIISNSINEQILTQGKANLALKVFVFIVFYTAMVMNSIHDLANPGHVPECIRDEMHEMTRPIAIFLGENPFYRNTMIILASCLMDMNVVILSVRWFFFEKNFKLLMIVTAFYGFRGFLQKMFFMKFPDDYVWGHPGLFSLSVAYAPANDFFFSGHCGMCTICLIHFRRTGRKLMQKISLFAIVYQFFTLLVTRAHYFIDLVVGIIIAHYIYLIFDWIEEYLNNRQLKKLKTVPISNIAKAEEIIHNGREEKPRQNGKDEETARERTKLLG